MPLEIDARQYHFLPSLVRHIASYKGQVVGIPCVFTAPATCAALRTMVSTAKTLEESRHGHDVRRDQRATIFVVAQNDRQDVMKLAGTATKGAAALLLDRCLLGLGVLFIVCGTSSRPSAWATAGEAWLSTAAPGLTFTKT